MCWSTALLGGRTLGWWWACERQRSADFSRRRKLRWEFWRGLGQRLMWAVPTVLPEPERYHLNKNCKGLDVQTKLDAPTTSGGASKNYKRAGRPGKGESIATAATVPASTCGTTGIALRDSPAPHPHPGVFFNL